MAGVDAITRFLHRKALRRIRRRLHPKEVVQAITPGLHDGKQGTLVLTNGRTFWVPKKGRIEVRRRGAMHDTRKGNRAVVMDASRPSWQVQQAPAAAARTVARASRPIEEPQGESRLERIERLRAQGRITDDEYEWMRGSS